MIKEFRAYEKENHWALAHKKSLIAISGGIDSVVLAHLFYSSGYSFALAHCNFQLRGDDSDQDQQFVEALGKQLDCQIYTARFSTKEDALLQKESIQVVARNQRYQWLREMADKHQFDYIATAHHQNDSVETMLFNLIKGCGIRGLHGILPANGNIIRPLLFTDKDSIIRYAKKHNLAFREDASNLTTKYSRNQIRLEVIPLLQQINPAFLDSAVTTIQRLRETEILFDQLLEKLRTSIVEEHQNLVRIKLQKLASHPSRQTILYEFTKEYGVNPSQIGQIWDRFGHSGKLFHTPDFQLLLDRDNLLVKPKEEQQNARIVINKETGSYSIGDQQVVFTLLEEKPNQFSNNPSVALLDMDKLKFPLIARIWKEGDRFKPFGLKGKHQKVKDYLINNKLSLFEKEKTWVLESDGQICWLIGHRIAETFKITKETRQVLQITLR